MRSLLLLMLTVIVYAGDADKLITDQWFVGHVNEQPAMTMHAVVLQHPDGTYSDRVETNIVLNRVLAGTTIAFEVRDIVRRQALPGYTLSLEHALGRERLNFVARPVDPFDTAMRRVGLSPVDRS